MDYFANPMNHGTFERIPILLATNRLILLLVMASVSDPSHFEVDPDPDPGIQIWEKWIRIRILGSTFGKSGSGCGSSDPPFRNSGSGSGSSDPHLEKVDPNPVPKWIRIRIRVPIFHIFHKEIHVGQFQCLFCYRQN